jgi:hypothetical protein
MIDRCSEIWSPQRVGYATNDEWQILAIWATVISRGVLTHPILSNYYSIYTFT